MVRWIPSEKAVPFDDRYVELLYPMRTLDFSHHQGVNLRDALSAAHHHHQGKIIGVEKTIKSNYLPDNRPFYGTPYGFESTADPFAKYMGRTGFTTGTRFAHSYSSLRYGQYN
jgi:hypothetical protein